MPLPTGTVILTEFSGKYSPDPILTNTQTHPKREGRARSQNAQRFSLTPDLQRSAQNASMRCNVSHRINKGPCGHPTDHMRLRRRLLTAWPRNLTLHKFHLASFIFRKIDLILSLQIKQLILQKL